MAIQLKKGSNIALKKKEISLSKVLVGLGWTKKTGSIVDLDASVFMLDANGKIPEDEYFVFYNNLESPDKSVKHTGDNRTGDKEGDDEVILMNLPAVDASIVDIVVLVSIHNSGNRKHTFESVSDSYIRIFDIENKKEVCRYTLEDTFKDSTDVVFAKIHRNGEDWEFHALGDGSSEGLEYFVNLYTY